MITLPAIAAQRSCMVHREPNFLTFKPSFDCVRTSPDAVRRRVACRGPNAPYMVEHTANRVRDSGQLEMEQDLLNFRQLLRTKLSTLTYLIHDTYSPIHPFNVVRTKGRLASKSSPTTSHGRPQRVSAMNDNTSADAMAETSEAQGNQKAINATDWELVRSGEQYTRAHPNNKLSKEQNLLVCDPENWREVIGLIVADGMKAEEHAVNNIPLNTGRLDVGRYILRPGLEVQQLLPATVDAQRSSAEVIPNAPEHISHDPRDAVQSALQQLSNSAQQQAPSTSTEEEVPTPTMLAFIRQGTGNKKSRRELVTTLDLDAVNVAKALLAHPFNKESLQQVLQDLMAGDATVLTGYKARLQQVIEYAPHLQRRSTICLILMFFSQNDMVERIKEAGSPISINAIKGRVRTYLTSITPRADFPTQWNILLKLSDNIRTRISVPGTPAPFDLVLHSSAEEILDAPTSPNAGPSTENTGIQGAALAPPPRIPQARLILQIIEYGLSIHEHMTESVPEAYSDGGIGHYITTNGPESPQRAIVNIMLGRTTGAGAEPRETMLAFVPSGHAQSNAMTEQVSIPFLASHLAEARKNHPFDMPKEQLADTLGAISLNRYTIRRYRDQTIPILRYAPHLHKDATLLLLLFFHSEQDIIDANHHLGNTITIEDVTRRVDQALRNALGGVDASKKATFRLLALERPG
ncbi:hypothetical protein BU16DRAFT_544332 [Lophium mytilinum]|uniref:Uncharacterized protein n=1 Tax=Lophium mytilinum TaxID=390894 RepID=A0A6A6QDB7_9PEZI|nr:hypothetical protein BU16DRAFT_544332 [Lophium mytilinum]